jgi:hypothetical protein
VGNRRQEKQRHTLGNMDRLYYIQYGEIRIKSRISHIQKRMEKKDFPAEIPVCIV